MDGVAIPSDDLLDPPLRLFERLRQIAGYTWDESQAPIHTSFDNWLIHGTRVVSPYTSAPAQNASSPGSSSSRFQSGRPSPSENYTPPAFYVDSNRTPPALAAPVPELSYFEEPVMAVLSYHAAREERAFHAAKNVVTSADPTGDHVIMPLDLLRLNPRPSDRGPIAVAIYKDPGPNALFNLLDLGPAFYTSRKFGDVYQAHVKSDFDLAPPIALPEFLDFAIGAAQCLEILHHSLSITHGEIRGDAFHYNEVTKEVRLVSFGSGLRTFEHGLTSTGWLSLSREIGAKNKLLYISPEQTGRMPAEPDIRTDIYSLGVLLWTLLTQKPVYKGESSLDIVQGVLRRRVPNVCSFRSDVPEILGKIIQKCTAKNIADRYQSVSGLRFDLATVRHCVHADNLAPLDELSLGTKDVSSFFMLPTTMIGRETERSKLVKVIERVYKSHVTGQEGAGANRFSDASSFSNDLLDGAEASSECASSVGDGTRHSGSYARTICSDSRQPRSTCPPASCDGSSFFHNETSTSTASGPSARGPRPWERHASVSFETRSLTDQNAGDRDLNKHSALDSSSSSSLSRQIGNIKFRQRGHCEAIMIEGDTGLGKSSLVQSVLSEARRRGYCATARFDPARRSPFGPLLKLLSSIFRQVWGERNTETQFHQALQQYVRPVWPMLHKLLGLPEFLIGQDDGTSSPQSRSVSTSARPRPMRRGSSAPGETSATRSANAPSHGSSSQDFLRAGASTKTTRFLNTFLDVLRMFATHKLICFCIDDLHYADDESLDLLSQIIGTGTKMIIIMTYRPDEIAADKIRRIISPPESETLSRSNRPMVTQITLQPLSEDDTLQYVSTTLSRPKEGITPLAMFIQSKTAGNPLYMREMLNACNENKCIWYEYRDSQWHFDMDALYEKFQNYDVLGTALITGRLSGLPQASRAILAWASMLGQSFSFELITRLLTNEFVADVDEADAFFQRSFSTQEAAEGLQAAIQAYAIVPSETADRFRFAHDRHVRAAGALKECNAQKMHFVIARTLMKYYEVESRSRDSTAQHIYEAVDLIRRRIKIREPFRAILFDRAQRATENGARPTAAKYYSSAVALLQPNPWDDAEDASYEETMQLYLGAADCALFMGHHAAANSLLSTIFKCARSPLDQAPAYVLQSRIFAQSGDADAAVRSLEECLVVLGVKLEDEPTYEKCDAWFKTLLARVQALDRDDILKEEQPDEEIEPNESSLASVGAVLVETLSAAWWTDTLQFYSISMTMLEMHLDNGAFPQSGIGLLHFAIIALARFNMVQFAVDIGSIGLELLERHRDPFTMSRGYLIFANSLAHLNYPASNIVAQMEGLVEYAAIAGDRISTIMSVGSSAVVKFFASENCADLEYFCQYGCEEISDWQQDSRGGTLILAVRQVCRALQGKTKTKDPSNVLSDEFHDTAVYKQWLQEHVRNGSRSLLTYETFETLVLYIFGHYDQAVEVGGRCLEDIPKLWSLRNSRSTMLVYGLALASRLFRKLEDPALAGTDEMKAETAEVIAQVRALRQNIVDWEAVDDVNYRPWSKYLEGQIEELSGNSGLAAQRYEEGLDHASGVGLVFEEALGSCLSGEFFLRQKARRAARAMLRDAMSLYRQFGAAGVADHIQERYSDLLFGLHTGLRMMDAAVQADFTLEPSHGRPYYDVDANEQTTMAQDDEVAATKGERIGAWRGSMSMQQARGDDLPALDMIDLHAILDASRTMSSELQVDELLKKMCDAILQTCGGSGTLASIVVHDKDTKEWSVAASGDPERGASAHIPGIPLQGTSLVAENVVLYCSRFRETVFIPDLLSDERFGNVSEAWLKRNPQSKSLIAIPICPGKNTPLLGVLYLEGEPDSFTDRNVIVLQLLVKQIGISYSNALAMKDVEKVSAQTASALSKAKNAEAEAKRNVKLAEEAARAKSIFLANVSHELRTPLNGVIGNSELLTGSTLDAEQLEMADSIKVSAELLLTVINDILDYSRMEADKMKLYISAFNPQEMVREVVRAASYSNREKAERVKIIQDINLPKMLIYGDPIRLHQVLGNLIGNSIKFTETGSVTIGARVEQELEEKVRLTFWVEDTGIGIPPQQLARLFQPFSQADASTARKYGGSGLGLSICKSLIQTMMKGKIKLESRENVGTRAWFTVTFDRADEDASLGDGVRSTQQLSPASTGTTNSLQSMDTTESDSAASSYPFLDLSQIPKEELRICIAEDNSINQKIAIQYVRRLGYPHVDAYDNGKKAVEGLRQRAVEGRPYHVILMDVQMPVLDGYEATKVIRKDPDEAVRKVLIIAMTASAIHGDREKCLAAGMNDYLAKPVRADVLKRKLEAYVGPTAEVRQSPTSSGTGGRGPKRLTTKQDDESRAQHVDFNGALGEAESLAPSPTTTTTTTTQGQGLSGGGDGSEGGPAEHDRTASSAGSGGDLDSSAPTERQPRKLTKSRTGLDAGPQGGQGGGLVGAQAQAQTLLPETERKREKEKRVLTKKMPG